MDRKIVEHKIPIKELSLWSENARLPSKYFNVDERGLIEYFLSDKRSKILELANEIVADFQLPQSERLIVHDSGDKKTVLDGNRRLIVYKLLINPTLINNPGLQAKFKKLKDAIHIDGNLPLDCLVTNDLDTGLHYVARKHLYNNNEVRWGSVEIAHHKTFRGSVKQNDLLKVEITKLIETLDFPALWKDQVLGYGFVTTLWRLIEQEPAWAVFGFSLGDNNKLIFSDKDFPKKLRVIMFDVLHKRGFDDKPFSRLQNPEIEKYLEQIPETDYKRVDSEIAKQTATNLFGKETVAPVKIKRRRKAAGSKSTLDRNYIIPKECNLQIRTAKPLDIYQELQKRLPIDGVKKPVPNAVGVLFRVFLEVSLEHYARKHNHPFNNKDGLKKKISWVTSDLEKKGYPAKDLKCIRQAGSKTWQQSFLSVDNFNDYIHSSTIQAKPIDLKITWNNLQGFFEILWNELASQGKN